MNKLFWNESDNNLVYEFKIEEDNNKRNIIFTKLYKTLLKLVEIATRSLGLEVTEDIIQDCMLRLYFYTIPKMDIERIKASQQYIFISLKRYLISYHLNKKVIGHTSLDELNESLEPIGNNIDDLIDQYDNRKMIDNYLDVKINNTKILNSNEMYFLLLLKNYIILNEYDVKGFRKYYIDSLLNKDKRLYNIMCKRTGISSIVFN